MASKTGLLGSERDSCAGRRCAASSSGVTAACFRVLIQFSFAGLPSASSLERAVCNPGAHDSPVH